jgi:organic radical activating enzyme
MEFNEMTSLYCVNAEHGFCTRPTGNVVPCCISKQSIQADDGRPANLSIHDAESIWNGQYLRDLRTDLNAGVKHKNCQQCWDEEAAGYPSKRIRDNERWSQLDFVPTGATPKLLDLSLGNTCNLACRTCGTFASSRWYKESQRQQLNPVQRTELKVLNDTIAASYDEQANIWSFLDKTLPEVLHIDFYGGEPMLVKRHWAMLDNIPDSQAENISLHFNTNGTQWDDEYAATLKRFKAVIIDLSIDGVEDKFEYMRWPAQWSEVSNNILRFKQLSDENPQIQVGICVTLSILNIWSLPETLDYVHKTGLSCYLNLLFQPASMCLKNLPDNARDLVLDRLAAIEHNQIASVREFIRSNNFDLNLRRELFRTLQEHDTLRNQSFRSMYPILVEALNNV